MINAKINRISNFLYGNSVQESIFNAFCYGLDHRIIQGGIEHKFGAVNKYLRNTAASTSDKETFLNIEKIRKEPDCIMLTPKNNVIELEIKCKHIEHIDEFLQRTYNRTEIDNVCRYHSTARFLYVDIEQRKLASLSCLLPMVKECQYDNWYHPWTWIEGLNNEQEYNVWANEFIFEPIKKAAEKIVHKTSKVVSK